MKKLLSIITITLTIFTQSALTTFAQTVSPSSTVEPTSSNEKLNNKINDLKEKIASRVSELNLVERRGVIGTISEISGNKIIIKELAGKSRIIDVDEITKFTSTISSKSPFGLSDLTKGTKISVLGLYNKQSKRLLARFVSTTVDPLFFSGTITKVDKKTFQVTLTTPDNKQTVIDVLTTTKTQTYTKEKTLSKSGFSELTVGSRMIVIGYPDKKDPSLLAAQRIIDLSVLAANPKIDVPVENATDSEASSTEKNTTEQ